jgi:hypothetical protein
MSTINQQVQHARNMPRRKKNPEKAKHLRQEHTFSYYFWHTASNALHSGTWFTSLFQAFQISPHRLGVRMVRPQALLKDLK